MRPQVVLCGSFHRDPVGLRRLFRELEATGCRVLSPISFDFDTTESFVASPAEKDLSVSEIEKFHLRAIRDADFIMLHAPAGHVGTSAAYELGFASALNIPAFSFNPPVDDMLCTRVNAINSVFEVLDTLQLISFKQWR